MIKSLILLTFLLGMNVAYAEPLELYMGLGMSPSVDKVLPGVAIDESDHQWYSDTTLFTLRIRKPIDRVWAVEYTHISDPLKTELDFGINLIALTVKLH